MATEHLDQTLTEAVERFRGVPFAWGSADCCLFVADVLRDVHGTDYAARWRGKYSNRYGAMRMIELAGGSLERLVSGVFGDPVPVAKGRRGCPVIADIPEPTLGVCIGRHAAFLAESGLAFLPMAKCRLAGRFRKCRKPP